MYLIVIYLFFRINFVNSIPHCLNFISGDSEKCVLCPFEFYDKNFMDSRKISANDVQCLSRNKNVLTRKILILNSNFTNETSLIPSIDEFNQIYNNVIQAFEEEANLVNYYLYSKLEFNFYAGDHYLLRKQIKISEEQLFRRNLVDIVLKPLFKSDIIRLILKTNEFYLFISKVFLIYNIHFLGNDITVQNDNDFLACYNSYETLCCSENDFKESAINDDVLSCSLIQKIITKSEKSNYYGLFNLEYIFDNPNMYDYPNLTFINCSFKNFFPVNISKGWTNLISLSPLSGNLMIENSFFENLYFPTGFIYYDENNLDFFMKNFKTKCYYNQ